MLASLHPLDMHASTISQFSFHSYRARRPNWQRNATWKSQEKEAKVGRVNKFSAAHNLLFSALAESTFNSVSNLASLFHGLIRGQGFNMKNALHSETSDFSLSLKNSIISCHFFEVFLSVHTA